MTSEQIPQVVKVELSRPYKFMYENFLIATQSDLYLLLEEHNGIVDILKFSFKVYKYGYPNDEVLGAHPLAKSGLGYYGLYEVLNSPWVKQILVSNRIHPGHDDKLYQDVKHYIIKFKDVTLDVLCKRMEEIRLTSNEV